MNGEFLTLENGTRLWYRTIGTGEPVVIPNGIYYLDDLTELARDFTLIAYDPRNRGASDRTPDGSIQTDIEDLDQFRRHFGIDKLNLIGHSYMGLGVALYGMTHPEHVARIVQIGPMQPTAAKQYPADLSWNDGVAAEVFGKIGQMRGEAPSMNPVDFCRKVMSVLSVMYVADPKDAARIDWGRCELPNELGFMKYWTESMMPSIQKILFTPEMFSALQCPVLTIHGRKDRNAPYGAGKDWAAALPHARLLTIENACHAPWVESPDLVLDSIRTFFKGEWPAEATPPNYTA